MSFVKTFKYDNCRSCRETVGKSDTCGYCINGSRYRELFDADETCVHNLFMGNIIVCVNCGGWCL